MSLSRRSSAHILLPLVVFAVLLLAAACAKVGSDPGANGSPRPAESATVAGQQPPADSDNDGVPDAVDRCPGQKEDARWSQGTDGCPDGIDDLTALAATDINGFWQQEFSDQGVNYRSVQGFQGYTGVVQTGCGPSAPNNAFYCPADNSVYYDRSFLETQLQETGDYGPVFILAHEWGHSVQANLGILQDPRRFTIQNELQADCLAGVYTRSAQDRQLLEAGDLEEAIASLLNAGDPQGTPWYDPQAHGTSQQRIDAFQRGIGGGTQVCMGI